MRVELDARVDISFGRRSVDWELKGVPVRLEVGPRDVAEGVVTLVRRDLGTKQPIPLGARAPPRSPTLLEQIQADMLADGHPGARRTGSTRSATVEEAVEAAVDGWAVMSWAALQAADGEARLREQGITVRCLVGADGSLPSGEDDPDTVAYLARAY